MRVRAQLANAAMHVSARTTLPALNLSGYARGQAPLPHEWTVTVTEAFVLVKHRLAIMNFDSCPVCLALRQFHGPFEPRTFGSCHASSIVVARTKLAKCTYPCQSAVPHWLVNCPEVGLLLAESGSTHSVSGCHPWSLRRCNLEANGGC